jgi:hypothetical protein
LKGVRLLEELAVKSYRRDRGVAVILSIVITLLIAALSACHVTKRNKQIGTRRALDLIPFSTSFFGRLPLGDRRDYIGCWCTRPGVRNWIRSNNG